MVVKLKMEPCPWCGDEPRAWNSDGVVVQCINKRCIGYLHGLPLGAWQALPRTEVREVQCPNCMVVIDIRR